MTICIWELLWWRNSWDWENKSLEGRATGARDQGGQSPEQNNGLWQGALTENR